MTVFRRALLCSLLALALAGCAADPPVAFLNDGGDAWTFEKRIEAAVPDGACDLVTLTTPRGTVMAVPDHGRVAARIPLDAGENLVRAECQKDGAPRGAAAEQHWSVRLHDLPKAWARAGVADGKIVLDGAASEPAPVRAEPFVAYAWRAGRGNPAPLPGLPAKGERVTLSPPAADGDYLVTLRVTDRAGRADESTAMVRVRNGRPEAVDPMRGRPAWADRAVIYGAVPFFFGRGSFDDITARLDELAALGVTALWLPPVTMSPPDDFGYAVTDHFRLRPTFGSEDDLRALIAAAHARGLKVIIDFVPNHVSDRHPYFAHAAGRRRASPYFDYFARGPDGAVSTYYDWDNLKNLNFDNPEVRRLVIEAFAHWVRAFDVDGFRVDAAWGPRRRAPDFWPQWRRELKRIKPDLLLLAEASARDPYYFRNGFDAAYDWTDKPGEWAWKAAFEDEANRVRRLRDAIAASADAEGLVFRFLNNNDTGPRFVTRYGVPVTRVAAAMLLTLPGLPGLYTGDAVGAAFEPYDEGPPIAWEDPHGLSGWYARLLALRHRHAALRSRAIRLLDAAPSDRVLAYLRPAAEQADSILVLLNYGPEPVRAALPAGALAAMKNRALIDLLRGGRVRLDPRRPAVPIDGYGVRILAAEPGTQRARSR